MAAHEVWGFTINTSPSGKRIWPNKLKREATRRIREDGLSPGEIAAELGAHECLVRKWWVADRRARGEKVTVEGPAFTELQVATKNLPLPATAHEVNASSVGRIHCGSLCFEFPIGIPEAELLKLVRVAGHAS